MSSGGKVGCSRSTVLIKSWIRSSNSPKFVSILNVRSHLLWMEFTDPKISMVIIRLLLRDLLKSEKKILAFFPLTSVKKLIISRNYSKIISKDTKI